MCTPIFCSLADNTSYDKDDAWEVTTLADQVKSHHMWLRCDHCLQQRVAIKTKGLQLKTAACELLLVYVETLGEHFDDYAEVVSVQMQ